MGVCLHHIGSAQLLLRRVCGYGLRVLATSVGESNPSEPWLSVEGCSIELRCEATRATLVVRGTLDVWSLAALDAQLDQLTYTSNEHLIIDLRGISTIDSEVIRVLESVRQVDRGLRPQIVDQV